jgi:hypothetical protein
MSPRSWEGLATAALTGGEDAAPLTPVFGLKTAD